jgi:hypothetical protein
VAKGAAVGRGGQRRWKEDVMRFISLRSVIHALKEREYWGFCAAVSTVRPVSVGPNLRLL